MKWHIKKLLILTIKGGTAGKSYLPSLYIKGLQLPCHCSSRCYHLVLLQCWVLRCVKHKLNYRMGLVGEMDLGAILKYRFLPCGFPYVVGSFLSLQGYAISWYDSALKTKLRTAIAENQPPSRCYFDSHSGDTLSRDNDVATVGQRWPQSWGLLIPSVFASYCCALYDALY